MCDYNINIFALLLWFHANIAGIETGVAIPSIPPYALLCIMSRTSRRKKRLKLVKLPASNLVSPASHSYHSENDKNDLFHIIEIIASLVLGGFTYASFESNNQKIGFVLLFFTIACGLFLTAHLISSKNKRKGGSTFGYKTKFSFGVSACQNIS
ncbi:MAG: hypothetical protein ABSG87_08985 [Verrucomicrobiota bacterium]